MTITNTLRTAAGVAVGVGAATEGAVGDVLADTLALAVARVPEVASADGAHAVIRVASRTAKRTDWLWMHLTCIPEEHDKGLTRAAWLGIT
jgi:hypothetical protein